MNILYIYIFIFEFLLKKLNYINQNNYYLKSKWNKFNIKIKYSLYISEILYINKH